MAHPRHKFELLATKEFLDRSTSALEEKDSAFAPAPGMLTVAQQVAHVGQTVEWFLDGMMKPEGFDMDFAAHARDYMAYTSLKAARERCDRAFARAVETFEKLSDADVEAPLPKETVMGGSPRYAIVGAIGDHTAHHRGALTVYARLLGKVPPMPYM